MGQNEGEPDILGVIISLTGPQCVHSACPLYRTDRAARNPDGTDGKHQLSLQGPKRIPAILDITISGVWPISLPSTRIIAFSGTLSTITDPVLL